MRSDVLTYICRAKYAAMMAAGLMLALGATSAAAQTRFAWPDTAVDVAKYTVIEQCLAAANRIRGGLFWQSDRIVWRDTMPADVQGALRPDPAPVTEAAVRCAARFPEPTANLHDFAPLLRLYLVAGRDADAKALVDRRMAAVPAAGTRERAAVSDSAVDIYLRAQPQRLDAAEQLLVTRARGAGDRLDRLELYARLVDAAQNAGDTARARRAATWVVAVADSRAALNFGVGHRCVAPDVHPVGQCAKTNLLPVHLISSRLCLLNSVAATILSSPPLENGEGSEGSEGLPAQRAQRSPFYVV